MGALTQRREGLKTFYRDLSERARRGESFGRIDAVALFFKNGSISRDEATRYLLEYCEPEDLIEYRKVRGHEPLE